MRNGHLNLQSNDHNDSVYLHMMSYYLILSSFCVSKVR